MIDWILNKLGLVRVSKLFEKQEYYFDTPEDVRTDNGPCVGYELRDHVTKAFKLDGRQITDMNIDIPFMDVVKITLTKHIGPGDLMTAVNLITKLEAQKEGET